MKLEKQKRRSICFSSLSGFFFAAFLALYSSSVSASSLDSNQVWVHCKNLQQFGLFEQCREVRILKQVGNRLHVYDLHRKKLMNLSKTEVFRSVSAIKKQSLDGKEQVLLPGNLVWQNSSEKTQTLCRIQKEMGAGVLEINCGKESPERVMRTSISFLGSSF